MMEINWGPPLSFVVSPEGDVQRFSTIEQVRYWLRQRWPVSDGMQATALKKIEAAMDCIGSVGAARRAFIAAARSAGFVPESLVTQSQRRPIT